MNILVTGGAGFIGSHLCDSLVFRNHQVTAIDNLSLGKEENIVHLISKPNFRFYKQDILDKERMRDVLAHGQFEIIFHLAANSDIARSHIQPEIDFKNTFLTTLVILEFMKEYNIKKIVFASSSAIFGHHRKKIDEDFGPARPLSHYGAAKLASEAFISSYAENYDLQAWIVRFPNVVGERCTHGIIFDFINKLRSNPQELEVLGDGEQQKPYIYVADLIEAILFILEKSNDRLNVFNISAPGRIKAKEIARLVMAAMGLRARIKFTGGKSGWKGDVPEFEYDITKLRRLGWEARYSSAEAIRIALRKILEKNVV